MDCGNLSDNDYTIEVVEDEDLENVPIKTEPFYDDYECDSCCSCEDIKEEIDIDYDNQYVDYDHYVDLFEIKTEVQEDETPELEEQNTSQTDISENDTVPQIREVTPVPEETNITLPNEVVPTNESCITEPTSSKSEPTPKKQPKICQPKTQKQPLDKRKHSPDFLKQPFARKRRQFNENKKPKHFSHKNRHFSFPRFKKHFQRGYSRHYKSFQMQRNQFQNFDRKFCQRRRNFYKHRHYNQDYSSYNPVPSDNYQIYSTILSALQQLCQMNSNPLVNSVVPYNSNNGHFQSNWLQCQSRPEVWASNCKSNFQSVNNGQFQIYTNILQAFSILNNRAAGQFSPNYFNINNIQMQTTFLNVFKS